MRCLTQRVERREFLREGYMEDVSSVLLSLRTRRSWRKKSIGSSRGKEHGVQRPVGKNDVLRVLKFWKARA